MNSLLLMAGLGTTYQNLISNWIGPAFLIVVAAVSIKFLISRQFRELGSFLIIAAIVAVLIFAGPALLGEAGVFKRIAEDGAKQLNTIILAFKPLL